MTSASLPSRTFTWKTFVAPVLLFIGAVCLFLALSATWLSTTVFDQKFFTETTKKVLATSKSREAIANVIVDKAFTNSPLLQRVAGTQATSLVSGLLDSDLAGTLYSRTINTSYAYLTSPNQEDVVIDLTSIKAPLSDMVFFAKLIGREIQFEPSSIPDEIVLLSADSLPDLYAYVRLIVMFNALFWIISAASFTGYIFIKKSGRARRIYHVCLAGVIVAVIGLITGPFVPSAIASFVEVIGIRTIIVDVTNAFLQPFAVMLWTTLAVTALVTLVVRLRHQIQSLYVKILSRLQKT